MKKAKQGNDFNVTWVVLQDNQTPLNTDGIYEETLFLVWGKNQKDITAGVTRTANSLRLEITPTLAPYCGQYSVIWRFKQPNHAFSDGSRQRVLSEKLFIIVDSAYPTDDTKDFEVTTILNATS